jgi:toxin FitB
LKLVLDTNVLIAGMAGHPGAQDDVYVASVSLGELAFGVEASKDPAERLMRQRRLDRIAMELGPGLPFNDDSAAVYGYFCGIVSAAGRSPRSRSLDLMIAATAYANDAGVATRNVADFTDLSQVMPIVAL